MKILLRSIEQTLADAALLEMGVPVIAHPDAMHKSFSETVEENLVEAAFAEAADDDEIHKAILREHLQHCRAA